MSLRLAWRGLWASSALPWDAYPARKLAARILRLLIPEWASGASLETWSYLNPGEGTQYVYFLNESDTVSFTAYTPAGVVY